MTNMENSDVIQEKQHVRKKLLELRACQDKKSLSEKSHNICKELLKTEQFSKATVIFGYYPIRNEVDVVPVLEAAFSLNKKVALPKCIDRHGNMLFYLINSFDDLIPGAFNIPEPKEGLKEIYPDEGLMLVPGVGFDERCFRLGYGGGYYDRFIGSQKGVSYIAPAYEFQICSIPLEAHDMCTDMVITEKRIIYNRH